MTDLAMYVGEVVGKNVPHWIERTTSWEKIVRWPRRPRASKEDAGSYLLGRLRPTPEVPKAKCGGECEKVHRIRQAVVSRSAITLDVDKIDGAEAGAAIRAAIEESGWEALVHTTYSSTEDAPRYRVLIPLAREVTPTEYGAIATWVVESLGADQFDPSSTYPWHLMYLPAGPGGEVEWWRFEGEWIDPDELLMFVSTEGFDEYGASKGVRETSGVGRGEDPPNEWQLAEAEVCFTEQVEKLRRAPEGDRNGTLVSVASKLMMLSVGGCLDETRVLETLTKVADEIGLETEETRNALASATEYAVHDGGERPAVSAPSDVFEAVYGAESDSDGGEDPEGCEWNECENAKAPGSRLCKDHSAARQSDRAKEDGENVLDYERHNLSADIHIARRIAQEYLEPRVRAFGKAGWGVWDGKVWNVEGGEDRIAGMIQTACLDIHRKEEARARKSMERANEEGNGDARKIYQARMKIVDRILMAGFLTSIQKMVRPYLSVSETMFDGPATRHLLNCTNGVVNLRTGEVTAHRRDYYFTKMTGSDYRPGAKHGDWETALRALSEEDAAYLQRRLGQAVTGFPPSDDVVTFLGGGGENGKSTIVDSVHRALGGFFSFVPKEVIADSGRPKHDSLMFELKGVRLAIIEELPRNRWLDVEALKDIAGTNGLKARAMRETFYVHWTATHSVVVTSNYLVRVVETDWSVWRRLERILFGFTFDGSDPERPGDPGLRDRLREGTGGRAEAVLAWLVEGARRWFEEGLSRKDQPESVKKETDKWRAAGNPIVTFANDYLEYDPMSACLSSDVYKMYREWSLATGTKPVSDQVFWSRLEDTDLLGQPGVVKKQAKPSDWRIIATREVGSGMTRMLTAVRVRFEDLGYSGYLEAQGASE